MDLFRLLKKLASLSLVAAPLLGGCFFFDDDSKREIHSYIAGFASDTTAILFSYDWETTTRSNFGNPDVTRDYFDIELKLVDIRFNKVYWSSKVKNNYGRSFRVEQWNDSTIIVMYEGRGNSGNFLWAVGNSKPQQITLNWNTEYEFLFSTNYKWFRWENDSLITNGGNFIIDTKTKTVNKREVTTCINWWSEVAGGGCLSVNRKSCSLSLLSEKGDTLGSVTYINECEDMQRYWDSDDFFVFRHFVMVKSPMPLGYWPAIYAFFQYDEKGNIFQEPLFWTNYNAEFIDSTGNIMEY